MLNHFEYLLDKTASVTPDRLELFAKIAAKRFIDTKVSMNDTIQKLADEHALNPHQVERVCEMANLSTHQTLWPHAKEKEKLAFELADSKKIKAKGETPAPKGNPVDADYAGPPKGIPSGGSKSLLEMLGVDPTQVHNGLSGPNERQRIIIVLQKKAAARQAERSKAIVAAMEAETAEKLAYKTIKQEVLGGTPFRTIMKAAAAANMQKLAAELLPKFEKQLISETAGTLRANLEKHAISRAPEDLISPALGSTTIVNGAHPVLISLDTVQKKNDVVKNLLGNILRIDDEVKIYNQQLKELG